MTRSIVAATKNPGKVREIRQVLADLGVDVLDLSAYGNITEPEETGDTFADNARDKALYYARATGRWCLADDSGLAVDALGGAPGVQSARYAADECAAGAGRKEIDAANNRKLLRELAGVPDDRRTARFVCHLALASPDGVLIEADDAVEGRIGHEPRGDNGFGYDPLFLVAAGDKTMAQLPADAKNAISHRGKALRAFEAKLRVLLRTTRGQ